MANSISARLNEIETGVGRKSPIPKEERDYSGSEDAFQSRRFTRNSRRVRNHSRRYPHALNRHTHTYMYNFIYMYTIYVMYTHISVPTHTTRPCSRFRSPLVISLLPPLLPFRPSRKSIRHRPGHQQSTSNGSDLHPLFDEREQGDSRRAAEQRRPTLLHIPQSIPNQRHYAIETGG